MACIELEFNLNGLFNSKSQPNLLNVKTIPHRVDVIEETIPCSLTPIARIHEVKILKIRKTSGGKKGKGKRNKQ